MSLTLFLRFGKQIETFSCSSGLSISELEKHVFEKFKLSGNDHRIVGCSFGNDIVSLSPQESDSKLTLSENGITNYSTIFVYSKNPPQYRRPKKGKKEEKESTVDVTDEDMTASEILKGLKGAKDRKTREKLIKQACFRGQSILEAKEFLQLEKEVVTMLVKEDAFAVEEAELFDALVKWATVQSKSTKPEDLKKVLTDDIWNSIRFPLMSSSQLATKVSPTNLLPTDQLLALFSYSGSVSVSPTLPKTLSHFSCKPRTLIGTSLPFTQNSNFDPGLFNWLGCGGPLKQTWTNPHTSGVIRASSNGLAWGQIENLVANTTGLQSLCTNPYTDPASSPAYVMIDLTPSGYKMAVTGYLMRHRGDIGGYAPRSWEFEAKDGEKGNWVTLRSHNSDQSIQTVQNSITKWAITGEVSRKPFTHFRIRMMAPCSDNGRWLVLQNLELYGVVSKVSTR